MKFASTDLERYSRTIILPEVGGTGQEKIFNAKVTVIGAGGLGSPLIIYLAAAGVGKITVVDHDIVDISNLQRQIIHSSKDIGKYKSLNAKSFAHNLNPNVNVKAIKDKISSINAKEIIKESDIIADGSDNFKTRFLVADTCFKLKKILVSAAITRYEGQISTWKNSKILPCFRCLFPNMPQNDFNFSCANNGVLGSLAGFLGSLQATEVIKEILGIGVSLAGFLNIYDLLNNNFRKIKVPKDPKCKFCSNAKN
tara:strand:- start:14 stop:775 length:762 start_codon:yes stop_codon:yes gene_type:complete